MLANYSDIGPCDLSFEKVETEMTHSNIIDITVIVRHETNKAILVDHGGKTLKLKVVEEGE